MTKFREIVDIHVQDINWIIALWLAVHGGDPAPKVRVEVDASTVLLAAALSARLTELNGGALTGEALSARLQELNVASGHGTVA